MIIKKINLSQRYKNISYQQTNQLLTNELHNQAAHLQIRKSKKQSTAYFILPND